MKNKYWRYYKTQSVNYPQISVLNKTVSHFMQFNLQTLITFFKIFDEKEIIKHIFNIIFYQPTEDFFDDYCSFISFIGKPFPKKYTLFSEKKVCRKKQFNSKFCFKYNTVSTLQKILFIISKFLFENLACYIKIFVNLLGYEV